MDAYLIEGGRPLRGRVEISGSKNASLPCLFASLLTPGTVRLARVPDLRDTKTTINLLSSLGKECRQDGLVWHIAERQALGGALKEAAAPYELVKQMRASVLSAGPMLARWGKARVSLPGGCAIGTRPIDIHLDGFKAMGARIEVKGGDLALTAHKKGLKPCRYRMKFPSVGATENLMMAAALIRGKTVLENAAAEPEISDLAKMLGKMGAVIEGAGTSRVAVYGVENLSGADHEVIADRIETGTFVLFAACVPGSNVLIDRCEPRHNEILLDLCRKTGVGVKTAQGQIEILTKRNFRPKAITVKTGVYPGFATDLQPLWMALMARARGKAIVRETIFENRFLHAAEMNRMGAEIFVKGDTACLQGAPRLSGAKVMAADIRAGAGLIAMALAASGLSVISRIYHIDRGYENLDLKLSSLGVQINRFTEVQYRRVS
ncbi:MAG: UDP-N-acetylglucosamine 1-carboxyvinyltransferase [Elusimicrobia bacterium]|nr:UDP-N-acetylglucosamine 1-carboxyvinyltransferase [Elusimicrobiota bacterium]